MLSSVTVGSIMADVSSSLQSSSTLLYLQNTHIKLVKQQQQQQQRKMKRKRRKREKRGKRKRKNRRKRKRKKREEEEEEEEEEDIEEKEQVAQLSLRDCAAGWVSYGQLEDCKWETIFHGHYRSVFNHYDVIDQQSNQIQRENAKDGLLCRSWSSKVIEAGINRKPVRDFLLVINSN